MQFKSIAFRLLIVSAIGGLGACAAPSSEDKNALQEDLLSDYHWDLANAQSAAGTTQSTWVPPKTRDGQPLRLTFEDQRLYVSGLCNRLSASYTLSANKIRISPPISTMMACGDDELMQYERAVGAHLPQAQSWSINENASALALTLRFTDGDQWILNGTPTDETRYGSVGETEFLEVAAHRIACTHPLIKNMQCLNVRTVQYNDAGLKTNVGNWHAFYDDIQGYTHTPGERNILRVTRYERTNAPADASTHAYVLDMIVESARQ